MNKSPELREIYLNPSCLVRITDQVFFRPGDDGVHQWESGIVLARFLMTLNPSCSVLELGSGSGLVGIACRKFTLATQVTLTDFNSKVLQNIRDNLERNSASANIQYLDWTNPETYVESADLVVGSDLIYDGAPIEMLLNTIFVHLKRQGTCYIVMPDKRKMTPFFLEKAREKGFIVESEELTGWYVSSPDIDEEKGFRDFAEFKMRKYILYSLRILPSIYEFK